MESIHWTDPFMTEVFLNSDYNHGDTVVAANAALERNAIVRGYFEGSVHGDTVDDCLAQHGINPYAFWEQANQNIDEVIELNHREIEGLDKFLRNPFDGIG